MQMEICLPKYMKMRPKQATYLKPYLITNKDYIRKNAVVTKVVTSLLPSCLQLSCACIACSNSFQQAVTTRNKIDGTIKRSPCAVNFVTVLKQQDYIRVVKATL